MNLDCNVVEFNSTTTDAGPSMTVIVETSAIEGANPSKLRFSMILTGDDLVNVRVAIVTSIQAAAVPVDAKSSAALFQSSWNNAIATTMKSKGWLKQ